MSSSELVVQANGTIRLVYDEALQLEEFGPLEIQRASHVEPNPEGAWTADLSPVGGPRLGPYALRSDALEAERNWLSENWLTQ